MKLSVREAATLMGRSPRTIRSQLARGELPGTKHNGSWRIEGRHLPLTESQRRSLQAKADRVRRTVEDALPSRRAVTRGQKQRSVVDLDAFRRGAEIVASIRQWEPGSGREGLRLRLLELLDQALLALAEGVQQFDRGAKVRALEVARGALARAVAAVFLEAGLSPEEPFDSWVLALETEVIPAVAGYARWADQLQRRRR